MKREIEDYDKDGTNRRLLISSLNVPKNLEDGEKVQKGIVRWKTRIGGGEMRIPCENEKQEIVPNRIADGDLKSTDLTMISDLGFLMGWMYEM